MPDNDLQYIPVNIPSITHEDVQAVTDQLRDGWISGESPVVREFEEGFASYVGKKYGVAVSSGSGALDATIEILDLKPGDEVILPSFTIISCIQQIVRTGATPILVDSQLDDWNMSIDEVKAKIGPRTKAIMAIHTYGLSADVLTLRAICDEFGLLLIEDAAEAHGQKIGGLYCGSFGDISIFSFYANKTLTTGEGGMVLTDDTTFRDKLRKVRNLCFQEEQRFVHESLGWNLRMSAMQAALGRSQLQRIDSLVNRKWEIGDLYRTLLDGIKEFTLAPESNHLGRNSYWVFGIVLDVDFMSGATMRNKLETLKVGTRPFFCPMHLQPALHNLFRAQSSDFPVASMLWEQGFYLPSGVGMTDEQVYEVAHRVRKVVQS